MAKIGIDQFIYENVLQVQVLMRSKDLCKIESIYSTARRIATQLGETFNASQKEEFLIFPGWGVDGLSQPKPYLYFGRFINGEIIVKHKMDLFEDLVDNKKFNHYHVFSEEDKRYMFNLIGDDEFYFPDHEFVSKI